MINQAQDAQAMFFKVPVSYRNVVVMPRCQKDETKIFGEWIEVHVAEVTPAEAPVAMRWKPAWVEQAPNGVHETRWFDGSHWEPVTYQYAQEPTVHVDVDMLRANVESALDYSNPLKVNLDDDDMANGKLVAESELVVRTTKSSGRDAAIAKAHRLASEIIFVDGLVWKRGPEPIYKFSRGRHIDVGNAAHVEHPESVFAADRWDDMLHHCSDGMEDLIEKFDASQRIDVLVPESVRFDDETPAITSFLKRAVGWMEKDVSRLPIERMVAWARFRDAVEEMNESMSPASISAAVAAVEEHVRVNYAENDGYWAQQIAKALNRWEMRPVRAGEVLTDVAPAAPKR